MRINLHIPYIHIYENTHDELFKNNFTHISICNVVELPSEVISESVSFSTRGAAGAISGDSRGLPLSFSNQSGSHFINLCFARPAFSEPCNISPARRISGITETRDSAVPRRNFVNNLTHADMSHQRVPQSGGTPGADTRGFGSLVVHVETHRPPSHHGSPH